MVKHMSELKVHELFALAECEKPFDENKNYLKSLEEGHRALKMNGIKRMKGNKSWRMK